MKFNDGQIVRDKVVLFGCGKKRQWVRMDGTWHIFNSNSEYNHSYDDSTMDRAFDRGTVEFFEPVPEPVCPFCDLIENNEVWCQYGKVVAIQPLNPVTVGHLLFLPVEHAGSMPTENDDVISAVEAIADAYRSALAFAYGRGEDFNLIINQGPDATQTVDHAHVHYVPRCAGDGLTLPWTGQHD